MLRWFLMSASCCLISCAPTLGVVDFAASFITHSWCNSLFSCSANLCSAFFQFEKPPSINVQLSHLEKVISFWFLALQHTWQKILYDDVHTLIHGCLAYQLDWIDLEYPCFPLEILEPSTLAGWWGISKFRQHGQLQASGVSMCGNRSSWSNNEPVLLSVTCSTGSVTVSLVTVCVASSDNFAADAIQKQVCIIMLMH